MFFKAQTAFMPYATLTALFMLLKWTIYVLLIHQ